jgi:hypothetical protein
MIPIDFWITSSKVKVTGALNVRMVSTHYLENYHKVTGVTGVTSSKVKGALKAKMHIMIGHSY